MGTIERKEDKGSNGSQQVDVLPGPWPTTKPNPALIATQEDQFGDEPTLDGVDCFLELLDDACPDCPRYLSQLLSLTQPRSDQVLPEQEIVYLQASIGMLYQTLNETPWSASVKGAAEALDFFVRQYFKTHGVWLCDLQELQKLHRGHERCERRLG